MNDEHKKLTGEDIPEFARWIYDDTSCDQALNLADVMARYSLPEETEYDIAKLLELKIKLSERNEALGLTREEFEEYQRLEEWFNNGL